MSVLPARLPAQTGPAGVGAAASNALWLAVEGNVYVDAGITPGNNNSPIQQWNDISGNGKHAVQTTAGLTPVLVTGQANGHPVLRFDGTTDRILSAGVATANVATIFAVVRFNSLVNNNDGIIQAGPPGTGFSGTTSDKVIGMWINTTSGAIWGRGVQSNNATRDISQTTVLSTGQFYIITQQFDGASIIQYVNGVQAGSNTYDGTLKNWTDFGIGRQAAESLNGEIAEIIVHRSSLNMAQRIITENYLAAKYGITLGGNDLYDEDNAPNGNYDHEVAGIGRVNATNLHTDAKGTAMVHILNPSGLGNDEFMLWGHDGNPAIANNNTDVPSGVQARLNRVWRVSEVNTAGSGINVGSVDLRWDLSGLGAVNASHLALLIDTDNDGIFSDETPVSGAASLGSGIYEFAGVTGITNNRRFTLGTTNAFQTALPLVLSDFHGYRSPDNSVVLSWQTTYERNAAFFGIERSTDGAAWKIIGRKDARGNSLFREQYGFSDLSPPGTELYYRLQLNDRDGTTEHSKVIFVVNAQTPAGFRVFPNPANDVVELRGAPPHSIIRIYNSLGKELTGAAGLQTNGSGYARVFLSDFPEGIYTLNAGTSRARLIKRCE